LWAGIPLGVSTLYRQPLNTVGQRQTPPEPKLVIFPVKREAFGSIT
jgi:hypothetical protein